MTRKLACGCTFLMIPALVLLVRIPSSDLTSSKMLIVYSLFGCVVFLQFLNRSISGAPQQGQLPETWNLAKAAAMFLSIYLIWTILDPRIQTFRELIRVFPGIALAMIWWRESVTEKQQRNIFRLIAVCGFIAGAGGVAQYAGLDPVGWNYSFKEGVFSTMGHPNLLAPLLVAAGAFQVTLGLSNRHRYLKLVWWSMIPVTLACLALTASKGAWFGAALALIITGITFIENRKRRQMIVITVLLIVVLLAGTVFTLNSSRRIVSDNSLRPAIWSGSLNMIDSPRSFVTGIGPGSWFIHFPSSRDPQFLHRFRRTENIRHAHSEPLELLIETGITGFLLFCIVWLTYFRITLKHNTQKTVSTLEKAAFFSLTAIVLHSFVSINLRTFSIWTLFWLIGAFSIARRPLIQPVSKNKPRFHRLTSLVTMIFYILALYISGAGTLLAYRGVKSTDYQYSGQIKMMQSDKSASIENLRKAVEYDPFNLDASYDLAVTLFNDGQHDASQAEFDRLSGIAPDFQRIHMNQAILYLDWGQITRNKQYLIKAKQAISRELALNDMDENYYLWGAVELALENDVAAQGAFEMFLERMKRNREELKVLNSMRINDDTPLVTPKNWDMLVEMETAAEQLINEIKDRAQMD